MSYKFGKNLQLMVLGLTCVMSMTSLAFAGGRGGSSGGGGGGQARSGGGSGGGNSAGGGESRRAPSTPSGNTSRGNNGNRGPGNSGQVHNGGRQNNPPSNPPANNTGNRNNGGNKNNTNQGNRNPSQPPQGNRGSAQPDQGKNNQGNHSGGNTSANTGSGHSFGVRPGTKINKGDVQKALPGKAVKNKVPSYLARPETQKNITESRSKVGAMKGNSRVSETLRGRTAAIDQEYGNRIESRRSVYDGYYRDAGYRNYYYHYYGYGFFGGYFYPVVVCDDIWDFFWYPEVWWMYDSEIDASTYQVWYGDDYVIAPFPYPRVYYPTVTVRDMGTDVSSMPESNQTSFRASMVNLTQALAQQISTNLSETFTLQENDIVIDHYENLQNQVIVVEGMVDRDDIHVPFKALLDLTGQNPTLVFVPTGDTPSEADIGILTMMNQRITALGGNPLEVDQEPTSVASNP